MKSINVFAVIILFAAFAGTASCVKKSSTIPNEQKVDSSTVDTLKHDSEKKKTKVSLWKLNEQSSKIEFTIKNFGKDVHGTLSGLKAEIRFDKDELDGSSFEASVPVNSINTGITKRDKDLMHEKYFNQEKFPEITFHSDSIVKSDNGFTAIGTLTIKGKAHRKTIPFTFEEKDQSGIFSSQFTLNRHDYDIGGEGPIMGDDINVSLKIITQKQASDK